MPSLLLITFLLIALSLPLPLLAAIPSELAFTSAADDDRRWGNDTIKEPGRCVMYDSCGRKGGVFGQDLPCAWNRPAPSTDDALKAKLHEICGQVPSANWDTACCTSDQLDILAQNLARAEPLIATCPACRKNFRNFYCEFTCSPDQSTFVTVDKVQDLGGGSSEASLLRRDWDWDWDRVGKDVQKAWKAFDYSAFSSDHPQPIESSPSLTPSPTGPPTPAVSTVHFSVSPSFGSSFFTSCSSVKFGATNGLAMDLLGGGARNWTSFVSFMGTERPGLGSPFSIQFPQPPEGPGLDIQAARCDAGREKLDERCACLDCPQVCTALPELRSPEELERARCRVGPLGCWQFALVVIYFLAAALFFGSSIRSYARRSRRGRSGSFAGFANGEGNAGTAWWRRVWPFGSGRKDEGRIRLGRDGTEGGDVVVAEPDGMPLASDPLAADDGDQDARPYSRIPDAARLGIIPGHMNSNSSNGRRSDTGSRRSYEGAPEPRRSGHWLWRRSNTGSDVDGHRRSTLGTTQEDSIAGDSDALNLYRNQPRVYKLNDLLTSAFYRLGRACAERPYLTIALGLVVCALLNAGWANFEVEKDPVRLWVAKGSASEVAKREFEDAFGPFYRTQQVFISTANGEEGPVLDWERLKWWASVEEDIRALKTDDGTTLADVCFAPTAEPGRRPDDGLCVVQSIMGYFGNDIENVDERSWAQTLDDCASSPVTCLPDFGQPLNPRLVVGGIPGYSHGYEGQPKRDQVSQEVSTLDENDDDAFVPASQARAVVVTYVINNSLDPAIVARAESWETVLKAYLEDLAFCAPTEMGVNIAFSTGVSLEEELNKSTNTDVPIVVASYLLMFLYVSISLGGSGIGIFVALYAAFARLLRKLPMPRRLRAIIAPGQPPHSPPVSHLFVGSRFVLGLWGIAIVLLSVAASVGLFSFMGVKITLIIAEVIPFLVLAIGVDNVFILAHELDRQNARAYAAMLKAGPGRPASQNIHHPLFIPSSGGESDDYDYDEDVDGIASPEERVARALGRMGPSIMLSAACETVAFALGALVGMPAVRNFAIYAAGAVAVNAALQVTVFVAAMAIDLKRVEGGRVDCLPCLRVASAGPAEIAAEVGGEGIVAKVMREYYAPALLKPAVKAAVVVIFGAMFVVAWIGIGKIELGLDQRLALPSDSYLVPYFNALDAYLDVGPPVYFVTEGVDTTKRRGQQQTCGRFSTCRDLSVANVLEAERKRQAVSYISDSPAVWIDDFFQWLNPALETCCRVKRRDPTQFCKATDSEALCKPCLEDHEPAWNITLDGLPEKEEFMRYLQQWLVSPADEECPLGGRAAYSTAIKLNDQNSSVTSSHFRTYHAPLKSQKDFINAMAASDRVTQEISTQLGGAKVYAYSIFYVFFDQYATIVVTTRQVLLLALVAVFVVTSVILGSWRTGAVVGVVAGMAVVDVMGMMGFWGVSLNAVSLVNLVISVGIAVEFCAHIARAFMGAYGGGLPHGHAQGKKDRDERAMAALADVGPSVFSGITLTKLIGIAVLALTRSKLLEVYYFRMWLSLIVSGVLHGLVLLPVALAYQGGQGYSEEREDSDWVNAEFGRRYDHIREGRPVFRDDDSEEEDRY